MAFNERTVLTVFERFRKKEKQGLNNKWTIVPGEIGTAEVIHQKVKEMNQYFRNDPYGYPVKAMANPLPYGMAQILVMHGSWM